VQVSTAPIWYSTPRTDPGSFDATHNPEPVDATQNPESVDGDFLSQVHVERLEFYPPWSSERDCGNSTCTQEQFRACRDLRFVSLHGSVSVPCPGSDHPAVPVPVRSRA